MASKRMSISALLSSDASPASQPSSPAPISPGEPPLKRQRQHDHQTYNQQYYESYKAYPYTSNTSAYYPQTQSIPATTPTHTAWPPRPSPSHGEAQPHWDDARRHVPSSTIPPTGALDFVRYHRQTSNLRGAEDEMAVAAEREREARWRQTEVATGAGTGSGKGESLVSVLTGQMRTRQGPMALPAPPQLRREVQQHQQQFNHAYAAPAAMGSPPSQYAAAGSRDISPILGKSTTPHATPPSLSPRSSYTPNVSPTTAYPPQRSPPMSTQASHHISPMKHPPPVYSPHTASPTMTAYPPVNISSGQHMPNIPQSTFHTSPASSHISHIPPPTYTRPNIPPLLSLRPPSRAPPPQESETPPTIDRIQSSPMPSAPSVPPAPPPQQKAHSSGPLSMDDRLFEDELLSLVDGDDVKPKVPQPVASIPPPQFRPPETVARKTSGSSKPTTAKPKAPPKPRAPAKSSKSKPAARQTSASGTPVPASSMPPPTPPHPPPPPPRAKAKASASASSSKKKVPTVTSARSPSLSIKLPEPTPTPAPDVEMGSVKEHGDDRLYCVCKTPYDEDRVMIACDRCDEWYHPACVGMPEVEVDLVDQFICSMCAAQNSALQSTYKQRCHRGLNHIASYDTLPPCWKPARGAFSKYCSDDCGMAHMRAKIAQSGRDPAALWPIVKNARRREGVTVTETNASMHVKLEDEPAEPIDKKKATLEGVRKARLEADEREMGELRRRLEDIMRLREECKTALERVVTRRRLLDLAVERAGGRFCGWDARLGMGDEEWAEWIETDEGRRALDGEDGEGEADWCCKGPDNCPRHVGWQNLRDLDVQFEVDSKNASIKQLTDRERDMRRRIEDLDPPSAPPKKSGGRKKAQGRKSTR